MLFAGTIKENLRWGNKKATDEEINEIIEYILEKHSNMLNEISFNEKNKEIIENIIKERLAINYSQIDSKDIFKENNKQFVRKVISEETSKSELYNKEL